MNEWSVVSCTRIETVRPFILSMFRIIIFISKNRRNVLNCFTRASLKLYCICKYATNTVRVTNTHNLLKNPRNLNKVIHLQKYISI